MNSFQLKETDLTLSGAFTHNEQRLYKKIIDLENENYRLNKLLQQHITKMVSLTGDKPVRYVVVVE